MNKQFVSDLSTAGFQRDQALESAHATAAQAKGLSANGEYLVQGAFRKGLVTLVFEQNTAADQSSDGLSIIVNYPAVCVVEGPSGKVACAASDLDLILQLAEEAA